MRQRISVRVDFYVRQQGVERVFELKAESKKTRACQINLTSPIGDEHESTPLVKDNGWVKGKAKIPDDMSLWLLLGVEELQGWWWPQGGHAITIRQDGTWEVFVYYGRPAEIGKFEILVIAVDSRTSRIFDEWYKNAQDKYSPMVLPKSAQESPSFRMIVEKNQGQKSTRDPVLI
jgi:hypothetical protein